MSFPGFSDVWMEYFEIINYRSYTQHTSYISKLAIEYELEMDTIKTTRTVYTFLDVLGQTGGIFGILIVVAMFITTTLQGAKALDVTISRLYIGQNTEYFRAETFKDLG